MPRPMAFRLHLLLILVVPLTFVSVFEHPLWAQETPSLGKASIQSSSPAAPLVPRPSTGMRFPPAADNSSLPFATSRQQGWPGMKFPPLDVGYHPSLININHMPELSRLATKHQPQAPAQHFIRNVPTGWLTHLLRQDTGRSPDRNDAVQYYGHRIPVAGRIILGIGKQADSHPRVTRIVRFIKPEVSMGSRRAHGK
jgi:hypothetical protein